MFKSGKEEGQAMDTVAHFVFIDQHKKTSRVGIGDPDGHLLTGW